MPFGPLELVILLFVLLLVFGAKRVPEMARSLGGSMREFKEGITNPSPDERERRRLDQGERPAETE